MAIAYKHYVGLMRLAALPEQDRAVEPTLGGKLLYVGEFDESLRPLIAAANIAGAATFAISAQQSELRQAQRDGLIDFLVNSLDEALRIFKNEIRKQQRVAVAVSGSVQTIESEMLERGVLPDLFPAPASSGQSKLFAAFVAQGALQLPSSLVAGGDKLSIWQVPPEYAQQPAGFDAILAEHLAPGDQLNRCWLRLSPRYLGTGSRRLRSIACDVQTAGKLTARIGNPIEYSQST